jgi:carboxypeptidase PM20D1
VAGLLPAEEAAGYDDLARSLRDPDFRARFFANRQYGAMVQTTFAVTMLRGSEKSNVIPPEAVARIDCWMLAGDDPEEIADWVRRAVADPNVQVELTRDPKIPNISPPDTELYKAMADTLRRRAPGAVVAPMILVAFTDNWVFRRCGLHGYAFSPFVIEGAELQRIHGNDERISLENVREGVRAYTELLVDVAGA